MNEPPENTSGRRSLLGRVLRNESFIEKALVLFLTAVVSGIFLPVIVRSIDRDRESRAAIALAQSKLFDDISETILTTETLALDVSWYGTMAVDNDEMQTKAFERYSERLVDLVAKWRAQSSRAQALASPEVAKKLETFLKRFFAEQDTPMNEKWTKCGARCDPQIWQERHSKNEQIATEANALILELAKDFGLVRPATATDHQIN